MCFSIWGDPLKKDPMNKNKPNLKIFLSIWLKSMWVSQLWKEGSDSFRKKKIISSEISAVEFTQINFNRI